MKRMDMIIYLRDQIPHPHKINPNYKEARETVDSWAVNFEHRGLKEFVAWNVVLHNSYCHPACNVSQLKNINFIYYAISGIDEELEDLCSEKRYSDANDIIEQIFQNNHPVWNCIWSLVKDLSEVTRNRFLYYYFKSLDSLIQMRKIADEGKMSIENYYLHRDHDITIYPVLMLIEYETGIQLSDDELHSDDVEELMLRAVRASWLQNDIISIEKDIVSGNVVNLANFVSEISPKKIPEIKMNLLDRFTKEREQLIVMFQKIENSGVADNVKLFSESVMLWVAGYFEWCIKTARYVS